MIRVNSIPRKAHYLLKKKDIVEVTLPLPEEPDLRPTPIGLEILYEDDDILVINKRAGIPVHPSPGHSDDTVVNALLNYLGKDGKLSNIGGKLRPGIVHRLDKDTSGVLIVAKNNLVHERLSKDFASREVEKVYEAIVKGVLKPGEGKIEKPIGRSPINRKKFTVSETGREAITLYKVLDSKGDTSWVRLFPVTGRTHQLRVHLSSLGHPIIGDSLYSRKSRVVDYIALVARELRIKHPSTGEKLRFTAPYPTHFLKLAGTIGYSIGEYTGEKQVHRENEDPDSMDDKETMNGHCETKPKQSRLRPWNL